MNVDPATLDGNIADICEKLSELFKREKDIKANVRSDIDIVEKDNLLRRIRVERRDLNRQLAELSVQKSLLENNVGDDNDPEDDDEAEEEEDAEEVGAADVQELEDDKTDEYHRLHNLFVQTRVDIRARKERVEHLLKDDSNLLLTDSKKRSLR